MTDKEIIADALRGLRYWAACAKRETKHWPSRDEYLRRAADYASVVSALTAQGMSAGTAETQSGSGLQPASPVGNADAPNTPELGATPTPAMGDEV